MEPIQTVAVVNVRIHNTDNHGPFVRSIRTWPASEEGGNAAEVAFKMMVLNKSNSITNEELEECLDDGFWEGETSDRDDELIAIVWSDKHSFG